MVLPLDESNQPHPSANDKGPHFITDSVSLQPAQPSVVCTKQQQQQQQPPPPALSQRVLSPLATMSNDTDVDAFHDHDNGTTLTTTTTGIRENDGRLRDEDREGSRPGTSSAVTFAMFREKLRQVLPSLDRILPRPQGSDPLWSTLLTLSSSPNLSLIDPNLV